jgi:hypothetical protein
VPSWIAASFGALDLRGHELGAQGYDLAVTPTRPGPPVFLMGEGAQTWLRLTERPVAEDELSAEAREIVLQLAEMGVAASAGDGIAHIDAAPPWLLSPLHELVYALLLRVAQQNDIEILFIKGPTLHAQGLRAREHSGDVDCWVRPGDDLKLARAMIPWGWTPLMSPFTGTGVTHSLTLRAGGWGCAIDVHCRFPGMTVSPLEAFDLVASRAEGRIFAGARCPTPDKATHSIIAALHEMRPTVGRAATEADVRNAAFALQAGGREVVSLVRELAAEYALAAPLRDAFPGEAIEVSDSPPPEDWGWRLTSSGPRRQLKALASVPLRQRPRVIIRLLWQSKAILEAASPDEARAQSLPRRWAGNFRRLGTATVELFKR